MLKFRVALDDPDAALTVNVNVTVAVGVPEIVPEELRVRPFGRVPPLRDHEAPDGFDDNDEL